MDPTENPPWSQSASGFSSSPAWDNLVQAFSWAARQVLGVFLSLFLGIFLCPCPGGRRLPTQPNCVCRGEPQCPHPSHATEMHIRQQLCWQLHGLRHPDKDSSGSEDRKRCTLQHRMNVSHVLSLQFVQILPKESCEFLGQWCQILLRSLVFEKRCQTRRHFEARSLPNVTKLAEDGQVQGSSARRLALQDLCHEADGVQHHAHVTNFFKFLICDGQWVILPRCAR